MADFNAGEKVPVVHFDFRPYDDWTGALTEPSFDQLKTFRGIVAGLINEAAELVPDADRATLTMKKQLELLGQMLEVDEDSYRDTLIDATLGLTGLDHDRFASLKWRIQQAFFGHLVQEYLRPEAPGTTATS